MRSLMTAGGAYECSKERVRLKRLGFEFRMKLAAEEPRVIGHFDNLHIGAIRRAPADAQTRGDELLLVIAVEFITIPMALADLQSAVGAMRERARLDAARPSAQAHGAAHFVDPQQFAQFVDHAMRGLLIEFGAEIGR